MNRTRRMILGSAVAAMVPPVRAYAKGYGRVHRVAVLDLAPKESPRGRRVRRELVAAMEALGYKEGRNIAYDWRFAEWDFVRLPALASEIVATRPDAIVTQLSACTGALANATTTIPIVGLIDDPLRGGFSLDGVMPRGNVTGFADRWVECVAKILELVKSFLPGFTRLGVLANGDIPEALEFASAQAAHAAARRVGVDASKSLFRTKDDIVGAFEAMSRQRIRATLVMGPWRFIDPTDLAHLAIRHRIAALDTWTGFVQYGALLAFGADWGNEIQRQSVLVDKVLRGMPPSRIPFELPERFRLAINRKTAAALKLAIPQEIYLRADQIFEEWKDWKRAEG